MRFYASVGGVCRVFLCLLRLSVFESLALCWFRLPLRLRSVQVSTNGAFGAYFGYAQYMAGTQHEEFC